MLILLRASLSAGSSPPKSNKQPRSLGSTPHILEERPNFHDVIRGEADNRFVVGARYQSQTLQKFRGLCWYLSFVPKGRYSRLMNFPRNLYRSPNTLHCASIFLRRRRSRDQQVRQQNLSRSLNLRSRGTSLNHPSFWKSWPCGWHFPFSRGSYRTHWSSNCNPWTTVFSHHWPWQYLGF